MKTPSAAPAGGRRLSLRRRTVMAFAGLAVVPLVLGLGVLFLVARHDVGKHQGGALAQDATLLGEQIQAQIDRETKIVRGLASMPEVRAHLLGAGPMPRAALEAVERFVPALREVELQPGSGTAAAGAGPALVDVVLGPGGLLHYRVEVLDAAGDSVGSVRAQFSLDDLALVFERFEREDRRYAALVAGGDQVLVGRAGLPLPRVTPDRPLWTSFSASGREYFAGLTPVNSADAGLAADWVVAVVEPAAVVYGPFYLVATQVAFLLFAFGALVTALAWKTADRFLTPILHIRHGAEIISRINLSHRIEVDTGDELEELAHSFNVMAENLAGAYDELGERVRETTRDLQEERNRLATVLRTMVDGVVVANEAGEVILMNPRARLVLDSGPTTGIGAPLGSILPRERLRYHLRRLRKHWDVGHESVEEVVFPLAGAALLRGFMTVVPGPSGERAGFLFVFRDHGLAPSEGRRPDEAVRQLPELLRGPAATVASLVQALGRHPDMPLAKQQRFHAALREEVDRLTQRIEVAEQTAAATESARWRGVPSDPRELIEEAVAAVPGVFAQLEIPEGDLPSVLVEPFSWVAALTSVLTWLSTHSSGWSPLVATLQVEDGTVVMCFQMEGGGHTPLDRLEALAVASPGEEVLTLGEAVRRNRGELWTRRNSDVLEVRLGLMIAPARPGTPVDTGIADQQPEFYDFDLFLARPAVEPSAMLKATLDSLEYVVFDSETTGLHPSKGDEMVSLSAVRLRRGKVQPSGTFHTLINPGMRIPRESIGFHGITDEMVVDAPRVEEVLEPFYTYARGAVLVAHNAAFDKKFLDIAANRAQMPQLENPILDTLFLSYGIHREFEGHNLDAIAARLGIEVHGRHTSLGDAQATAQIFLRLIALLSSRGIHTLGDAKAFCDRMLLLRWQSSRF